MRTSCRNNSLLYRLLAALLVPACAPAPAVSADLGLPEPAPYVKRLASDLKELPSKPGSWNRPKWLMAGGILALTGGAFLVDENVRDFYGAHRFESLRNLSFATTHFGDYRWQVPVIAGFWTGGRLFNSPVMSKIAADGAEASAIAALIINPTICYLTGRALPSREEPAMRFKPLTPGRYSFPSGHTTAAFALATVIDVDLRGSFGYWQTPVLYGMALGVANSRLYDSKHYLSEVILGGGIGWGVGYWIASKDRSGHSGDLAVAPYHKGAKLSLKF